MARAKKTVDESEQIVESPAEEVLAAEAPAEEAVAEAPVAEPEVAEVADEAPVEEPKPAKKSKKAEKVEEVAAPVEEKKSEKASSSKVVDNLKLYKVPNVDFYLTTISGAVIIIESASSSDFTKVAFKVAGQDGFAFGFARTSDI
jgi:hypothetical protein